MLPVGVMPSRTVTLSGGDVVVHGLTMAQVRQIKGNRGNAVAISFAVGCTEDEADAWIGSVPAGDVTRLLDAVTDLTGLSEGAQFPQRPADVPGDARAAE